MSDNGEPRTGKRLLLDGGWACGVAGVLAAPVYTLAGRSLAAVIVHVGAVAAYVLLLAVFGRGFALEAAIFVAVWATAFALLVI